MDNQDKQCLWMNFGAVIDMLHHAIDSCPDDLWQGEKKFYYLSYHTTIFLDYYASYPVKDFNPYLPYTLWDTEQLPSGAIDDVIPADTYSREDLLNYIGRVKEKCRRLILGMPTASFHARWIEDDEVELHGLCPPSLVKYSILDILFYNLRHVQHHVGQLNLLLRQKTNSAPAWVAHSM
jgi:hypothetical protein